MQPNKSEILKKIVHNPAELYRNEYNLSFDDLVKRYPYFQTAHLLRLISIYHQKGIFQPDDLSLTALHAGSRTHLYHLLKKENPDFLPGEKMKESRVNSLATKEILEVKVVENKDILPEDNKVIREKTDTIIDKFIREQPSIQKPTAEFFSASVMASKSLQDSEELVSETLAEIYVRQENYRKAIKIYEKLLLLYPEKNDKFALLIENLKNKITD
jgi:hypothetical protein